MLSIGGAFGEDTLRRQTRDMTISDFLNLQEINQVSVSPDGKLAAYCVLRANFERNDYLSELFLVTTDGNTKPDLLVQDEVQGEPRCSTAFLWSNDGDRLAFVKRGIEGDDVQLFNVRENQEHAVVKRVPNITLKGWSTDQKYLVYTVTDRSPTQATMSSQEPPDPALQYDGSRRISGREPWAKPAAERTIFWSVDVASQERSRLDARSAAIILPREAPIYQCPKKGPLWNDSVYSPSTVSPDGKLVAFVTKFLKPETKSTPPILRGSAISVWSPGETDGPRHLFRSDDIAVFENSPIWSRDGTEIFFLERSPDSSSIYRVSVADGGIRRVHETKAYLNHLSWDASREKVVAVKEEPTVPPELVSIDVASRKEATLARPNAYFDQISFPATYLMRITNTYGHEMSVRVTPPDGYIKGRRYPLIATTYTSGNAFQRGAVGDEYPIYAYAAKGFVVASLDVNPDILLPSQTGSLSISEIRQLSPIDTLDIAIERLVRDGIVDKGRCGIMGLSYGAEIVEFALWRSKTFQVASTSTAGTVWDLFSYLTLENSWRETHFKLRGLAFPDLDGIQKWSAVSVALNAGRVHMPVLLQPPDSEATNDVQIYLSLKKAGVPVEMQVYPNEGHVKVNPWSRYWACQRNVDWMSFWLQDSEDPDRSKIDQYKRWRKLRSDWQAAQKTSLHDSKSQTRRAEP